MTIEQAPVCPRSISPAELGLLAGFLFFLPLAEAPKNILLYSFLAFWAYRSWKTSQWGGSNRMFEWPLLAIVLASLMPVIFRAEGQLQALSNCADFFSIVCLMIVASRSRLTVTHSRWLALAVLSGILVTVLYGHILNRPFPSLHSVGHINQVAIYLGISAVWFAGIFYGATRSRLLWASASAFTTLSFLVIFTESRNALFGVLITIAFLPILGLLAGGKRRFVVSAGMLAILIGLLFLLQPPALKRQISQTSMNQSVVDDARQSLWRSSWLVAKSAPPFGYGVGFFREGHTPVVLEGLVPRDGVEFKRENYVWTNHAHNLILNWLVERGGGATTLFVLWITFVAFVLLKRSICSPKQETALFSARTGFAVLISTLVMGIGNTTWHHEHGLLAAIFIGFAWAATQQPD